MKRHETTFYFHNTEDGRVFDEPIHFLPVAGDWIGFDEDLMLVTRQVGPNAFDCIEHPKKIEIHRAMFAMDVPGNVAFANADKIARDPETIAAALRGAGVKP